MTTARDSQQNASTASGEPAGKVDPQALTVEQLARLLGLPVEKVRRHIEAGAPTAAGGTVSLVHYAAWLNKGDADGD
jgi:hypothetical protein